MRIETAKRRALQNKQVNPPQRRKHTNFLYTHFDKVPIPDRRVKCLVPQLSIRLEEQRRYNTNDNQGHHPRPDQSKVKGGLPSIQKLQTMAKTFNPNPPFHLEKPRMTKADLRLSIPPCSKKFSALTLPSPQDEKHPVSEPPLHMQKKEISIPSSKVKASHCVSEPSTTLQRSPAKPRCTFFVTHFDKFEYHRAIADSNPKARREAPTNMTTTQTNTPKDTARILRYTLKPTNNPTSINTTALPDSITGVTLPVTINSKGMRNSGGSKNHLIDGTSNKIKPEADNPMIKSATLKPTKEAKKIHLSQYRNLHKLLKHVDQKWRQMEGAGRQKLAQQVCGTQYWPIRQHI